MREMFNIHKIEQPESMTKEYLESLLNIEETPVTSEVRSSDLETLFQIEQKLKDSKKKTVVFPNPIITQNGLPMFYPKTINVIQGKKGQHKSRLAECICSALLKKEGYGEDILGLKSDPARKFTVCLVDTERNKEQQLVQVIQKILLRAGYQVDDDPDNFRYTSLIDIKRDKRLDVLGQYIEHSRESNKDHLFIVLDVLTDCVSNFNDPKDSLNLIDMLNMFINAYDVTFLCVIHENPNGEKARGHLGTELINKSSTVLQVGYVKDSGENNTDIIKVHYSHCRSTKQHPPFFAKYSDEGGGLVQATDQETTEALDARNTTAPLSKVAKYLSDNLKEPTERVKLINGLTAELNCEERTIEKKLKHMLLTQQKIIVNDLAFILVKEKKGKNVVYHLQPLEDEFL